MKEGGIKLSSPAPERQAADLWGRILKEARQLLPPKTFDEWVRPVRPTGLRDGCLRLRVPTPHHRQILEDRLAEALRQAVARAGLEDLRLEFVVPDEGPAAEAPEDGAAPRDRLRAWVRETRIMHPDALEGLIREAEAAGCDVDAWADECLTELRRPWHRAARTGDPNNLPVDPFALCHSALARRLGRPTLLWRSAADLVRPGRSALLLEIARTPALILSPRAVLELQTRLPDGSVVEVGRAGRLGWSPEAAAVFLDLQSRVLRAGPDDLRFEDGRLVFDLPRRDLEALLGRRLRARDVRRLDRQLTATLHLAVYHPRKGYARLDDFHPIRGLRWTAGQDVVRVLLDGGDVARWKDLPPEAFRFVAASAARVLRDLPPLAAALALFLSAAWHGRQGLDRTVGLPAAELWPRLTGAPWPKSRPNRSRARRELEAAAAEINRRDELARYGIEPPRWVVVEFDRGAVVRFRRTTGPVIDDDPVNAWLVVRTVRDPSAETETGVLYADYVGYCRGLGLRPLDRRAWGRAMGRRFRPAQRWRAGRRVRVWQGVRLKNE